MVYLFLMSKRSTKKGRAYTYNTTMGTVAKDYGIRISVPPETKLGDFFKDMGLDSFARILKMMV